MTHVQGCFKAGDLITRSEAGQCLAKDQPYLIDETTATVRFIIPCTTGQQTFAEEFHSMADALNQIDSVNQADLDAEVGLIRTLFFQFFVEAVVATVNGEEEIWLLESGCVNRLYRWKRARRKPSRRRTPRAATPAVPPA